MVDMNIEQARHNMIEQQIRPWEVLDQRILDLITHIPREDFVPEQYRNLAFADLEIPIGNGQSMMTPKIEARMLQALNIQSHETVLEIGTGSGYVTALLATLGKQVVSIYIHADFCESASQRLAAHNIDNVIIEKGDAAQGWEKHGKFDAIAITGSVPVLAESFKQSLTEGGRLFVVTGEAPVMEAQLITRIGENEWRDELLFETELQPLLNAPKGKVFKL